MGHQTVEHGIVLHEPVHEPEADTASRGFDLHNERLNLPGKIALEACEGEKRIVVYANRHKPLDHFVAIRPGGEVGDILDDEIAIGLIRRGIGC